jgi:glycerophosphoryl diester phosphodiesterase
MTARCRRRSFRSKMTPWSVLFTVLIAAVFVSAVADRQPDWIDPPRPVLNIAHAGASSLAPQNTVAAGRKAFEIGVDLWGVDVRLTKDGVFVLMHDATLDRTTDVEDVFAERAPWRVEDFTLDEIKLLDAGSWFVQDDPFGQIESGNVPPEEVQAYIGEPIPTLHEALAFTLAVDGRIDIEVKPMDDVPRDAIAERLLFLIEETKTRDRVLISSFDHDLLRAVKRLDPAIPIGALAVFAPLNAVAYLKDLEADVYEPSVVGYTLDLLAHLAEEGIGVYVWTYNSTSQLEHLATVEGVRGIYTDFPQRLEPILDRLYGTGEDDV